jgi:midasin
MVHLYIPNHPLDPEGANVFRRKRLSAAQDRLTTEIELHECAEILSTGRRMNPMIQDLKGRLEQAGIHLRDLPPSSSVPRDMVDLQSLFSELLRFHDQLLDVGRMRDLLQALIDDNATATSREQVNQDSWNRFMERIRTRYPSLGDLWYPLGVWLSRVRIGMSLLRHATNTRSELGVSTSTSFLQALTTFPTVVGCDMLGSNTLVPPPHLNPLEWSTNRIWASISQIKGGDPLERHRMSLWGSFEQLFGLWLQTKLREDAEEKEKNSLYKKKKDIVTVQAEEEAEAEEFRRLFPEYDDVLDDSEAQSRQRGSPQMSISPYQLFLDLLILTHPGTSPTQPAPINLAIWIRLVEDQLQTGLDNSSVVFRLRNLYRELQGLQRIPSPADGYDFYHDSNVPEVLRALDIIQALEERLSTLAEAWPEQMVLRHLLERCQAIARLNIYSSLARILSALEQLLLQTDDWQKYADKENGILEFQQSLGNLIIDWRRIELSCWAHLLDTQATAFSNGIADWWFRLYESLVETSKSVQADDETDFLNEILPLLEDFLIKSPTGQFTARLHLLEMFKIFIVMVYPEGSSRPLLKRIARLLGAIIEHYRRFTVKVQSTLASRREIIDKEVKSFIKLASWKDVNVLALKASAQRTHHQLHRSIRRFRAVLQEPVTPLLAQTSDPLVHMSMEPAEDNSVASFVTTVPPIIGHKSALTYLTRLQDTLQVFQSISHKNATPFLERNAALTEELSSTVLSRIDELQTSIAPPQISNKKAWAKNLLNRKRKAFSDLLKACKEIGLPSQLVSKDRALQEDRLWLMERRSIVQHPSEMTAKMDLYFDKILSSLPTLQSALGSHSDDISTRDLTKLLDYTHGIMHYALEARAG